MSANRTQNICKRHLDTAAVESDVVSGVVNDLFGRCLQQSKEMSYDAYWNEGGGTSPNEFEDTPGYRSQEEEF